MRGAVIGSGVVHVGIIGALFLVRQRGTIVVAGPEVVQVALLEPAAPTPAVRAPAPPPPPKPAPPAEAVKPTEEKGVRIEPPRKPKPATPAPRQEPAPAPALPYAAVGNAGLKGQVSVDTPDFEFTYYLMLVRNKIAQNWTPPTGTAQGGAAARAVVYFRIGRGGDLSGIQLETGSGIDFFDRTAVRAVVLSDPLPPLPLGYTGADLGVHFGFEYAGP